MMVCARKQNLDIRQLGFWSPLSKNLFPDRPPPSPLCALSPPAPDAPVKRFSMPDTRPPTVSAPILSSSALFVPTLSDSAFRSPASCGSLRSSTASLSAPRLFLRPRLCVPPQHQQLLRLGWGLVNSSANSELRPPLSVLVSYLALVSIHAGGVRLAVLSLILRTALLIPVSWWLSCTITLRIVCCAAHQLGWRVVRFA